MSRRKVESESESEFESDDSDSDENLDSDDDDDIEMKDDKKSDGSSSSSEEDYDDAVEGFGLGLGKDFWTEERSEYIATTLNQARTLEEAAKTGNLAPRFTAILSENDSTEAAKEATSKAKPVPDKPCETHASKKSKKFENVAASQQSSFEREKEKSASSSGISDDVGNENKETPEERIKRLKKKFKEMADDLASRPQGEHMKRMLEDAEWFQKRIPVTNALVKYLKVLTNNLKNHPEEFYCSMELPSKPEKQSKAKSKNTSSGRPASNSEGKSSQMNKKAVPKASNESSGESKSSDQKSSAISKTQKSPSASQVNNLTADEQGPSSSISNSQTIKQSSIPKKLISSASEDPLKRIAAFVQVLRKEKRNSNSSNVQDSTTQQHDTTKTTETPMEVDNDTNAIREDTTDLNETNDKEMKSSESDLAAAFQKEFEKVKAQMKAESEAFAAERGMNMNFESLMQMMNEIDVDAIISSHPIKDEHP